VPHNVGFWLVAAAFVSLQAFGTVPTPLWPLYAIRDGLSPTTVTLAFACMVVGAGASLYLFGHLSDRMGRRRIIVPALGFGAAVMAWWPTLPGLLIGRVLTGVAVGLMASTATIYLTDLYRAGHPAQPRSRVPATVASVASLGGLSLGPLVAGVLLRWAGHPFTTSYLVFIALMVVGAVLVSVSPETVDLALPASASAPKFVLRHAQSTVFAGAAAVAFCSFAVFHRRAGFDRRSSRHLLCGRLPRTGPAPGSADRRHAPDQQPVGADLLQCGHPGGLRRCGPAPGGSAPRLEASRPRAFVSKSRSKTFASSRAQRTAGRSGTGGSAWWVMGNAVGVAGGELQHVHDDHQWNAQADQ
jgi:hypothetical protein